MILSNTLQAKTIIPIKNHQIIWLKEGNGVFEVDFKKYLFQGEELLFLAPGQYFRILEGDIRVNRIDLVDSFNIQSQNKELLTRVLFSHVIAVGSIHVTSNLSKLLLSITTFKNNQEYKLTKKIEELLTLSVNTWIKQKPFDEKLSNKELDLIFDLKHLIDNHYWERSKVSFYNKQLDIAPYKLNQLTKSKLNRTPGELERGRVLLEAERKLVFTSESAKEITYDLGFNDPSHFSKFFKNSTGYTTSEFRNAYRNFKSEIFIKDLLELIESNYRTEKSVTFYADKLSLSPKSLSAKVRESIGKNVSDLIASRIVADSKKLLIESSLTISSISAFLGFKDPSHFSHFFKKNTNYYPAHYRELKQD